MSMESYYGQESCPSLDLAQKSRDSVYAEQEPRQRVHGEADSE